MSDWIGSLDENERSQWDAFVREARREAFEKIDSSAFVMQLVPREWDVKIALELGAAIMLNKPIIAIVMPESRPSEKLLQIADLVVEADPDTEEGKQAILDAVTTMGERFA